MSSPNATGCVTLLLSAAMANKIKIAPVNMKRIVENSAMLLQGVDRLGQGHGLIQVQSAWDLIVKGKDAKWKDVGFSVKVESQRFSRGIYLRQPLESNTADTYRVTITTDFHDDVSPMAQTEFESRTLLSSTVPWVKCAERVLLVQGSKTLAIFIDPRGLPPGVHVAFVRGCDEAHPELGPQFQIPITVIRPEIIADQCSSYKVEMESKNDSIVPGSKPDKNQLTFTPGERLRRFIVPPKGCTFIDAVVTDCRTDQGSVSLTPSVIPSNVDTSDADVDVDVDGDVDDSGAGTSGALDGTARLMCVHAVQLQRGTAYNVHHKQVTLITYISYAIKLFESNQNTTNHIISCHNMQYYSKLYHNTSNHKKLYYNILY